MANQYLYQYQPSTYVGQKPEVLRSVFFLQCWGVVGWLFVGAGMEGLFFATGPVPWMRRRAP